jgi:hypothetical protein
MQAIALDVAFGAILYIEITLSLDFRVAWIL